MDLGAQMENLAEDIAQSKEERKGLISSIRNEAGEIKREVADQLSRFRDEREGDMESLKEELSQAEEQRQSKVAEVQSDARDILAGYADKRREMNRKLRKDMAHLKETLSEETRTRREEIRGQLAEWRDQRRAGREAWQGLASSVKSGREEPTVGVEDKKAEESAEQAEEGEEGPDYYHEMVEILGSNPEGLRLAEIGEILEVDWRQLIPAANELISEGRVRKEDRTYYLEE